MCVHLLVYLPLPPQVPLPLLIHAPDPSLRSQLLLQKLRQCQRLFDFSASFADKDPQSREKAVKTEALREVNDLLGQDSGVAAESETVAELFRTVECNLFRYQNPT